MLVPSSEMPAGRSCPRDGAQALLLWRLKYWTELLLQIGICYLKTTIPLCWIKLYYLDAENRRSPEYLVFYSGNICFYVPLSNLYLPPKKIIIWKSSYGLSTEQVVKIQTLIVLPQFLQAFWPALQRRERLPTWIANMRQTPSRSSSPSLDRSIAFEPGHLDNAIRNLLFLRLSIKFQQIQPPTPICARRAGDTLTTLAP